MSMNDPLDSMPPSGRPIIIATRGSALALAQANTILDQCRAAFPPWRFEIKIIKTTGDKLQSVAPTTPTPQGTKGLFTKELEIALLNGEADLAVHSLKDLPTELPEGLVLAAVSKRADARDVLICRAADVPSRTAESSNSLNQASTQAAGRVARPALPQLRTSATVATSSTRRQAQLLALRPDLHVIPIRGNVGTRLKKLATQSEFAGLVLAAAGLERLNYRILPNGQLEGASIPDGLLATHLSPEEMLPCVGQGALGIETRVNDERIQFLCAGLNHPDTYLCVLAERALLRAMGGGCLSPIAAYAEIAGDEIWLRAVSFRDGQLRRSEARRPRQESVKLGEHLAATLK